MLRIVVESRQNDVIIQMLERMIPRKADDLASIIAYEVTCRIY